jgi:hypothetical protein
MQMSEPNESKKIAPQKRDQDWLDATRIIEIAVIERENSSAESYPNSIMWCKSFG